MGSWYWIGVAAGLGAAAGVAIGALIPGGRRGVTIAIAGLLAVVAGIGIGLLVGDWAEAAAGAIGGLLGAAASVLIVSGALRSGGTRLGVAVLVVVAGLGLAALAFVPGARISRGDPGPTARRPGQSPRDRALRRPAHPREGLT